MADLRKLDRTWLCSVLFLDIVNYSSQSVELQMKWKDRLNGYLTEAIQDVPENDRVILDTGDGAAICFLGAPEVALFPALHMQSSFAGDQRDEQPALRVRAGINLGPVKLVKDINGHLNALGDGINDAQRVMSFAGENQVLASRSFFEVVSRLSDDYSQLFRFKGTERDKHAREHVVYELLASGSVLESITDRPPQTETSASRPENESPIGRTEVPRPPLPEEADLLVGGHGQSARPSLFPARTLALIAVVLLAASVVVGIMYLSARNGYHEKDAIVVADFDNRTGESGWDDVLKIALTKDLQDSHYLNVLPDDTVSETLKLMKRDAHQRLTGDLARQVCLRNRNKAFLTASIIKVGAGYHLDLRAVNCRTGITLAGSDAEADGKEKVIAELKKASSDLLPKLVESLASVEKPQWTSTSPEALDAYDTGLKLKAAQGSGAAVPSLKSAIELDPDFADAYAALCAAYGDLGEDTLSMESCRKAYELRDNVKNPCERFHIEADYYDSVTGEIKQANQTYLNWIQVCPADQLPHQNLAANYSEMGQYDKAIEQEQLVLRAQPNNVNALIGLMGDYLAIDQPEKANSIFEQARERKLDHYFLGLYRYYAAFLEGDSKAMQQQLKWATGQVQAEDAMLSAESDTEAFYGRFNRARSLTSQAVQSAKNADMAETAAGWNTNAAMREAEVGNDVLAHQIVVGALEMSRGRDVELQAALALARSGQAAEAEKIAAKLDAEYPHSTMVQSYWLPTIRAAIALGNKDANKAIDLLGQTIQYELGEGFQGRMYPPYLRGEAYLMLGRGNQASLEFQKILDHRGIVLNFVIGALARLQLARAAAMSGDTVSARQDYEEFLELWKGADTDLSVLKAARDEYSRLK